MELSEDEVKVTIEEVLVPFALVLVLTNEVYIVAQALHVSLSGLEIWLFLTPPVQTLNIFDSCLLDSN